MIAHFLRTGEMIYKFDEYLTGLRGAPAGARVQGFIDEDTISQTLINDYTSNVKFQITQCRLSSGSSPDPNRVIKTGPWYIGDLKLIGDPPPFNATRTLTITGTPLTEDYESAVAFIAQSILLEEFK
jgi:hypothetical protein